MKRQVNICQQEWIWSSTSPGSQELNTSDFSNHGAFCQFILFQGVLKLQINTGISTPASPQLPLFPGEDRKKLR